jgi:hypothetical protein
MYVYQVIERQWEPLCVVKVFDRAPYPKFGRFPGGMDLAVCVYHLLTHAHAHTYSRTHGGPFDFSASHAFPRPVHMCEAVCRGCVPVHAVQTARRLEPGRPWCMTILKDFDVPGSYSRFRVAAINAGTEVAVPCLPCLSMMTHTG